MTVPAGGVIGAASSGVHCEPRGLVSRTPVSPTNGRMSISTKFCIGTVPTFCTRSRYSMAPPMSVPGEVRDGAAVAGALDGLARDELGDAAPR